MRFQIVAAVLLISTSNMPEPVTQAFGQTSGASTQLSVTLDSLRDRYRPVLIFTPAEDDPRFLKQVQLCASGQVQAYERQVVFVPISYKREAGSSGTMRTGLQTVEFSQEEASKVRRRFGVAPKEFTVLLIGKDGGEKFRTHTPVTIERLNALIDAMPMRQQEVRDGNSK